MTFLTIDCNKNRQLTDIRQELVGNWKRDRTLTIFTADTLDHISQLYGTETDTRSRPLDGRDMARQAVLSS